MLPPLTPALAMSQRIELRFEISKFTPDTLPVTRLGEYLVELGRLLGVGDAAAFSRIEKGSAVPVVAVREDRAPTVYQRLELARSDAAPAEVTRANVAINTLLREDGAGARLRVKGGRRDLLVFPGASAPPTTVTRVQELGSLQGELRKIGGADDSISVVLRTPDGNLQKIETSKIIAQRLAVHLFQYVRLHGRGTWVAEGDGRWELERFTVLRFDPLDDVDAVDAIEAVRALDLAWDREAVAAIVGRTDEDDGR